MGVYDTLTQAAIRLISQKGQTATWESKTNDAPTDPSVKWKGVPVTTVTHSPKIVFLPNERYGREMYRYFAGSDIPVGNMLGFMARVNFTPSLKDTVIRNGETLSILSITPYDPNGEGVILYTLEFDGIKSV